MKYDLEEIKKEAECCLNCKNKPCSKACPLSNDIPLFISHIKNEEYEKAREVLSKTAVMPSICGRICPHGGQCEGHCVRGIKGEPVKIGMLEAFASDITEAKYVCKEKNNIKIAVIGGGPAGLACAQELAINGYNITIFEREEKLGGILNYGIPDFRLDREIIDKSIKEVIDLGIEVKTNQEFMKDFTIDDLFNQSYEKIFLGIGANISSFMKIEGIDLGFVLGGNELLRTGVHPDYKDKKVAIIGGGNVAMDVSRTVKRLGAKISTIIYRRSEEEMPASLHEIRDARLDNVEIMFQTNLTKIERNGRANLCKTELVKAENEDRLVPVNVSGSEFYLNFDYIIMAVGAHLDKDIISKAGLELDKSGYIKIDENYNTSIKNVFAGGDLIGTKGTVSAANKTGIEAAKYIMSTF